ncbi:hypothetical protein SAMN04487760_1125 [Lachnospiraceae bacterium G41]|nr:hypothetical protein SAMN04487760_1125 [Lachnospiraceae bacterium G41]
MCLFRKILAGQAKDRPGSDEPGFLLFIIDDLSIYANALEQELALVPKTPSFLKDSNIYKTYLSLSQKDNDAILSHVTALELLGFFSGYGKNSVVEYYAINDAKIENTLYHSFNSAYEIGFVFCKGMRSTDINRTFNDILLAHKRIDDSVLLEALNTYYYKHHESFSELIIGEDAKKILLEYKDDAINYC